MLPNMFNVFHFHKLFSFFLVFKYFRDIWGRYLEIPTVSASLIILIFKLNPRASSNPTKMLSPLNTVEKSCSLGERMSRYEQGIGLLSASFLFPEPLMHCFWHLFQLDSAFFPTRPCPFCVSSFCGRWIHTVGVLNLHHRWPWVRELPLGDKGEWIKAKLNDMFIASHSQ